jgi:hypothetical protein
MEIALRRSSVSLHLLGDFRKSVLLALFSNCKQLSAAIPPDLN